MAPPSPTPPEPLASTAEIFVPAGTPATKVNRIAGYGARVIQGGDAYADALAASRVRQAETGALEVHAYDHEDVIAGQGTVGREFQTDAPELTHILVATGGGGLIGGIAAWYAGSAEIVNVEPEGCPTLTTAMLVGRPSRMPGLRPRRRRSWRPPGRRADVSDRAGVRDRRDSGDG